MGLLTVIKNEVKAAVGYQQSFEELLKAADVSRAVSMMTDKSIMAIDSLKEYNINEHEVMNRPDKAIFDKKGKFIRWSKRNKLPIPYQTFINEIAVVFLYGRPVKWLQLNETSEMTDYAFAEYKKLLLEIRFDAHVREAKRHAGAEGTSAILYHVYKDNEGKPKLLLKTLSKQDNDDIYILKDQYGRLKTFAWGYYLTEEGNKTVHHIDIYTDKIIYQTKRGQVGWEVQQTINPIGKIPVILFEQEPEHKEVQPLIERSEQMESREADVIDRFSDPAMVATADIINNLPKQEEEAKMYILKGTGDVHYLTWDEASQSKKNAFERLNSHILSKSFTPNIDFDNMKSLGNMSAKAIRKVMLLAFIKADKHKEQHDGYMNRHASLTLTILGNVLDYKNKSKYEALNIGHEFQEPFGDDVSEALTDILKQYGAGALSLQTTLELSYLVKDAASEYDKIKREQQANIETQIQLNRTDVFGEGE